MELFLTNREKKLRYGSPWLTILYFCLPTVLIMLIQGFYNIVDKSLALAFAAPDLANDPFYINLNHGPIDLKTMKEFINIATQYATQTYNLLLAFAVMAGMGCAMNFSIAFGKEDKKKMTEITGNGFSFTLLFSIFASFLVFCLIFPQWHSILITSQMGNKYNAITNYLAWEYSYPMLLAAPLMFLSYYFVSLLRSEGRMNWIIIIMLSSVLINAGAAVFFMKVCHLKMQGAMLGTVFAWLVQVIWGFIIIFRFKNSYSKFTLQDMLHLKANNIFAFLKTGSPNFLTSASFVVTSFLSTALVVTLPNQIYHDNISLYQELISAINPWLTLIFSAGIGISQGSRAIIAYNFGAQKYNRIWQIMKRSSILFVGWFVFILIILAAFGDKMIILFAFPSEFAQQYRWWLVLSFASYPLAATTLIAFTLYQGTNKAFLAAFTSSLRALTVAVPVIIIGYFVALATGTTIVYFVFLGLIDFFASLIIIPILIRTWLKVKNKLVDVPDNFKVKQEQTR